MNNYTGSNVYTFQIHCPLSDSAYYSGCMRKEYENMRNTDQLFPLYIPLGSIGQQFKDFLSQICHLDCNA